MTKKFKIGYKVEVEKQDGDIPNIVGTVKKKINLNTAKNDPELMMEMGFTSDYNTYIDEVIHELGNIIYKVHYDKPYVEKIIKDENYRNWATVNNIDLSKYPSRFVLQSSPDIKSKIKAYEFIKKNNTIKSPIEEEYVFPHVLTKHRRTAGGKTRGYKTRKNTTCKIRKNRM
jgi:hypothetical protein